jgi:hypothetical protein
VTFTVVETKFVTFGRDDLTEIVRSEELGVRSS